MRRKLLVGVTLCSIAHPAFGQAAASGPRFDVRLAATDAYEDNVLRINDTAPVPAGYTRSDYRFTPSLDIDISRPVGLQTVFLNGSAGYDFYRRNSQLERERIDLVGGADTRFGVECQQHAELGYSRSQSDLRDFTNTARLKNAQQRVGISANVSCGGVFGLKPGLSYDHQTVTNSAALRKISNYSSDTFGASLGYVSPVLGEISVYGSYRRGSYPNRLSIFGTPQSEKIDVYSGGLRFNREIGRALRGSISLGYTTVRPQLAGTPGFNGVSYGADLIWTASDRFQTAVSIGRSANQSNLLNVSYSIDDHYSIDNTLAVGESIRIRAGASFSRRSFRDSPLTGPNLLGRSDRLRELSSGVSYSPPGRFSYSFDVIGSKRNAAASLFNYKYLTARFAARFRI